MLPASSVEKIISQLIEGLKPLAIYLFGSYARGDATSDSDLDLLVIVEQSNQPRFRRSQKARALITEKSISKDILVLTKKEWEDGLKVVCSLPSTVNKEGKLLYES